MNKGGLLRSHQFNATWHQTILPAWIVKIMKAIIKGKLCKWKSRHTSWGGGPLWRVSDPLVCSVDQR